MYNIPDNYDRFEMYEREQERQSRINRNNAIEEEFDTPDLPFTMSRRTMLEFIQKFIHNINCNFNFTY